MLYVICENGDLIYIEDKDNGIWWQKLREEIPLLTLELRVAWLEKIAIEQIYIEQRERQRENELLAAAGIFNGKNMEPPKKITWWKRFFGLE